MSDYGSLARASSCYFDQLWRVNQAMSRGEFTNDNMLECMGWADGFALVPYTRQCPRQYYNQGVAYNRLFSNPQAGLRDGLYTEYELMLARALAHVRGDLLGSVGNTFTNDAWEWAKAMAAPGTTLANLNGNRVIKATDVFTATDNNVGLEGGVAVRSDLPNTEFDVSYNGFALAFIRAGDTFEWRVYCNVGTHTLRLEYSNGGAANSLGTFTFNGGQTINISTLAVPTGGWSTYSTITLSTSLTLVRGWNTIQLTNANELNINSLQIQRN